jgi:hypothetical protein
MWLLVGSLPFWRTVTFGQNGLWLLAILSAAWACWKNKQEVAAGLILSLTLAKPQLFGGLYLGVLLFLSGRVMAGLFLGGMVWLVSGFALRGVEGWMEWIRSIQLIRSGREHVEWQHSLLNLFDWASPSLGLTAAKITVWGIFCIFWLRGLIILWRRERIVEGLGWALWGGLLLTPRLYQYDLILLFPLMVGWAARAQATSEFWMIAGVNTAIYGNDFFMETRFPFLSLILLLLFFRFYRKIAFQNPLEQNLRK